MSQRKIHYAWVVAAAVFVVLLCSAGVRATPSVLIVPLEREFGWSRALISGAVSLNLVLYGLVGPFAAALMQAFGIRRTTVVSLSIIAVGVALTNFMSAPWQLFSFWGVLVGLGTGTTAMVLGATVVHRWFVARRGLVMGLLTASTATGQLVFLPVLASLAEHHGWRSVSLSVAAIVALIIPFVALVFRDRPSDVGARPYGAAPGVEDEAPVSTNPLLNALGALGRAARLRDFWLLAGSFFICGATTNGLVGTHLVPACMDHGIPEVQAAGLLAVMGIFDLVGTTASGWLSDRFDSRWLLFWYYGLRGLALLYLPAAFEMSVFGLPLFAVFYGLDWIATVPPTVRLTTQTVGPADGPIAFGWIVAAHQVGAGVGALGAGVVRTALETYTPAWVVAGIICMVASVLVLRIGRRPRLPSLTGEQPA
ncbi:MFS transporter [Stigmatella aurantiaca]|uniref:Major facilitator superfamily MFS-1 n=1 Tax=Stigmatella aurantiaca (strain DW4/3-1) TaxID=378806 RepID=Q08Q55_STIAD|nr:MFS transporter [Stigmatella aurantiaca]ADO71007.1 Major facilitator superfamily MFS-1 [Stigmatella aurantiaca DW4/3-1]EAU62614.1 monocarboxylate MFS permease [Stigmatella aurantiaca DW4/3-1]